MNSDSPIKLGKYNILMEIAEGSMGKVFLGHDSFINREVAIKVSKGDPNDDQKKNEMYRKLFFNEAHTAGKLNHPNILAVYDAGTEDDTYYIVMEYVSGGKTLKSYCSQDNLLPINKAVEIIFRCAKALHYAHGKGVIHRDIKPSNILVTEELDVRIADFSIAFMTQPDLTLTQPLGLVGSPMYMSPEQVQEDVLNNQTDIFSLGILMYELLSGIHPFKADNFSRLIYKIANEKPTPICELRPELPKDLQDILDKALGKKLTDRYANGLEMASDLSSAFGFLERPAEKITGQEQFNIVKELSFFSAFPDSEIWEVLRVSVWNEYQAEKEILTEGKLDDAFYIIVAGQVEVRKTDSPLGRLKKGDCFGEMGYITKEKRTASIYSSAPVILLKINSTSIEQTSLGCQLHFHKVFLRTLIQRLSQTTEKLFSSTH